MECVWGADVAFDVVYCNGRSLLSESCRVRRAELEKIIQPRRRVLELIEQVLSLLPGVRVPDGGRADSHHAARGCVARV
jgi:hypothetical protein